MLQDPEVTLMVVEKAKETLVEGEREAAEKLADLMEEEEARPTTAITEDVSSSEESTALSGKPLAHAISVRLDCVTTYSQ